MTIHQSKQSHLVPVSGDGLLSVLYWLWTYGVLWRELKAEEEARTSSSLIRQALGWSSGSSCSLCSREHRIRSRRWEDSLRPHWACTDKALPSTRWSNWSFLIFWFFFSYQIVSREKNQRHLMHLCLRPSHLTSAMAFLSWTFPVPSSRSMFLAPSAMACSTR